MQKITTLLILISMMVLPGCGRKKSETRNILERMIGMEIVLPEKVLRVYEGEEGEMDDVTRKKPKLLVYVDSTNCAECQISKFFRLEEILKEADSLGTYDVVLLLSPKEADRDNLVKKTKLLYMPFPVYIDVRNEFMSKNKVVPEDALYHIMYVGTDGRIRMVGDPSASDKVKAVFDEVKDVE